MKRISINLTNEEYVKLELIRGENNRSRYLGRLISSVQEETKEDLAEHKKTLRQINHMKNMIRIINVMKKMNETKAGET